MWRWGKAALAGLLLLGVGAPAAADRVVDADQPVIVSDDVRNRATEVISASDGPRGELPEADAPDAEAGREAPRPEPGAADEE